jgi:hypothetical protein
MDTKIKDISKLPTFQKALLVLGVLACAILLSFTTCESAPYVAPPPPCKDMKLNPLTTQQCPHADHVLETSILKPSVCKCKNHQD